MTEINFGRQIEVCREWRSKLVPLFTGHGFRRFHFKEMYVEWQKIYAFRVCVLANRIEAKETDNNQLTVTNNTREGGRSPQIESGW